MHVVEEQNTFTACVFSYFWTETLQRVSLPCLTKTHQEIDKLMPSMNILRFPVSDNKLQLNMLKQLKSFLHFYELWGSHQDRG
jgi:hypothetical protein